MNVEKKSFHQKIIEEYTPEYCYLLEKMYGKGMMSEGGSEAIEHMFSGIDLNGKTALDFGSGMGGVALYLADTYNVDVTGIDINPWMASEATKRIPKHLSSKLRYLTSTDDFKLDFPDSHFDILCSKGALAHIDKKKNLFDECKRILKPDGIFVITDSLSPIQNKWGPNINRMATIDGLTIFAHTKKHYLQVIKSTGFNQIDIRDDSLLYRNYNQKICEYLLETRQDLIKICGEDAYQENLEGYNCIVRAFDEGELIVKRFKISF